MPPVDTQQALDNVLRHPAIWRAQQVAHGTPGISTAYPALDQILPERGWPVGALTELLVKAAGAGELSLLMPALRAACAEGRGIALVAPPWLPHARAWEAAGIALERMLVVDSDGIDLLWAAEQILRSGECGAVLVWGQAAGRALNNRALQRLHLAANTGNAACFLYRSVGAETSPSPAPLRIRLEAQADALQIHVVKCRGAIAANPVRIQIFPAHWNRTPAQAGSRIQLVPVAPRVTADATTSSAPPRVAVHPQIAAAAPRMRNTSEREADANTSFALTSIADAAHLNSLAIETASEALQATDTSCRNADSADTAAERTRTDVPPPVLIPVQLDLV